MSIFKEIKEIISEIESNLVEIRRDLHRHPELGFEEVRTAKVIATILTELGLTVKTGIARTGVVGLLEGEQAGPVIALRADMDALTIEEKNQVPYASKDKGKMHACGHDAHVTILLGAAMVLSRLKDRLPGTVKFIFQPAEEGPGGAKPMIEQGVLENPPVDRILGLHVWLDLPAGHVGLKKGPGFASVDQFDLLIKGKSAHGALPHQGVDAIVLAAQVISALQTAVSRKLDPTEPAAVTVGKIAGGYRRNIIAEEVGMEGTVRTVNPAVRTQLATTFKEIVGGTCRAAGGDFELDYREGYPTLNNDDAVVELIKEVATAVVGTDHIIEPDKPTLGGEDFAYFLERVPGCFFLLGARNEAKGITAPHHNPYFDLDESVLALGVEMMVRSTLRLMEE